MSKVKLIVHMIVYRICTYDLYAYFVRMIVHMFRTYDFRTFDCTDDLFTLSVHLILHMICSIRFCIHLIVNTYYLYIQIIHRIIHMMCTCRTQVEQFKFISNLEPTIHSLVLIRIQLEIEHL